MASSQPEPAAPIGSLSELTAWFTAGNKPKSAHRCGIEHEKIGVLAESGDPVPYFGERGIVRIFAELMRLGWRPVREGEHTIALERDDGSSITLEPGCQFELSDAPRESLLAIRTRLDQDMRELLAISEPLGIAWLGIGMRPFSTFAEIPWVPKGRYVVMREFLPTRGKLWREMMQRTATVQANLDYTDEADAMAKLRAALSVTSIVTALFANSPLCEDAETGELTSRGAAWLDTDEARCGILPFAFGPEASFRAYTEWALDVPMFFIRREGRYLPEHPTFRAFLANGAAGQRATIADWELHLSTLFPEVRLKRYVEVRGADNGPIDHVRALPALWTGLLYDEDARSAATALTASLGVSERETLRREVPRAGLRARAGGRLLSELAVELIAIAGAGLTAQGVGAGERALLEPLAEIAASGVTHAERVLEVFRKHRGARAPLVDFLRYRA